MKNLYRAAVATLVLLSTVTLFWWGWRLALWGVGDAFTGAFHLTDRNAKAMMLLRTAATGFVLAMTWQAIARYRRAFPRSRARAQQHSAAMRAR